MTDAVHGTDDCAALDALLEFGRAEVDTAGGPVDRGHREPPIKADYVGKNLPTSS